MPNFSFEASLVALTLSGVERLRQAFEQSTVHEERVVLLRAAAELLDRTLPHPALKPALSAADGNPVPVLVENRERIAAVPPGLWRPSLVRIEHLPEEHRVGFKALEEVLRRAPSQQDVWGSLAEWAEPAWKAYPQLKPECLELHPRLLKPAAAASTGH